MSIKWEPKFIGRENELRLLETGLNQAKKGLGNIFFITGEAGVGKTRLVLELAKEKEQLNFEFLTGQCIYREGTDPYLPFIDMFKGYLSEHPYLAKAIQASFRTPGFMIFDFYSIDDKRYNNKANLMEDDNSIKEAKKQNNSYKSESEHNQKGPYNKSNFNDRSEKELDDESSFELFKQHLLDGKDRMYETISRFIIGITKKKTLVLFIDDVHWADEASLHLLHYLARNIRNQKILILCAYRTEEVDVSINKMDPLQVLISRLGSENLFSTVELQRLDQHETKEIVEDLLNVDNIPDDFAELIYRETEGNPFFIKEVIKSLLDDGSLKLEDNNLEFTISPEDIVIPMSIQELIKLRVQRLDNESIDVLEYASVIANEFQFEILSNIIDIPESKLINILSKLTEMKIIEEVSNEKGFTWRFTHNKIHEVIYNNLTENKKRLVHLKLARFIEDTKIDNLDEVVYDLAYHFYKGVDFDRALSYSIEGGEKAMRAFAYKEALDLYNIGLNSIRLLDEHLAATTHYKEKKIDVLFKLGILNRISGDFDKALTYFEQILQVCDEISFPQQKANTLLEIGRLYEQKNNYKEARRYFEKSLELAKKINDDFTIGELYQGLGLICEREGDFKSAVDFYTQSLQFAEMNQDTINLARLHGAFGRIFNFQGDNDKALEHKLKSIKIFQDINALPELAKAYNSLGLTYLDMGNIDKNIEYNDKCIELADRISDIRIKGIGLSTAIEALVQADKLDLALDYATNAYDIFKKLEDQRMIAISFMKFGIILKKKGEWDSAIDNFRSAIELMEKYKEPYYIAECYRHFSDIYQSKGENAKAKYYRNKADEIINRISQGDDAHEQILLRNQAMIF